MNQPLPIGTKVETIGYVKSGHMTGTVVGYDTDSYHARVNGQNVYFVRWNKIGVGGGWVDYDTKAIR